MKHAYLIMAHSNYQMLEHLVNELDDVRNDIFIHIDAKAPFDGSSLSVKHSNIIVLDNRIDAAWADYSLVEIEILLLKASLARGPYAYYHLLSGADMPIKSQDYIHELCDKEPGKEYVAFSSISPKDLKWRAQHHFSFRRSFRKDSLALRIVRGIEVRVQDCFRPINRGITFKKGSQWFSITNDLASFIIKKEAWITDVFSKTFAPDEMVLQTLVWNSEFKDKVFNIAEGGCGNMRFIKWKDREPEPVLTEWIPDLKSSSHWFTRKCNDIAVAKSISAMISKL